MDFDDLRKKNQQNRDNYKPRGMKTDSENEFTYGIVFILGFLVLFGAYFAIFWPHSRILDRSWLRSPPNDRLRGRLP